MFSRRNYEGVLDAAHRNNNPTLDVDHMLGAMDKVQAHSEDTQDSGSGSGFSDLSLLENETDDFGRRLLQHQRDAVRWKAIHGNQQAFRKAIPRPRIADVLDREEKEGRWRGEVQELKEGSVGSSDSDPPVTIPREWGRKAKKQEHWMSKILEPSENGDAEEIVKADDGALFRRRTVLTGDRNDGPRPSMVRTPPKERRQEDAPSTPPSSMRHMNTTLKTELATDEQDFSSVSLLTSTPAKSRIPRKIDELARREVEILEQQGLTSKTLSQMNQRPSTAASRRPFNGNQETNVSDNTEARVSHTAQRLATATGKPMANVRRPQRRRSADRDRENFPLQETAQSANGSHESSREGVQSRVAQPLNLGGVTRPGHRREDSMNLLRKLARVSSMSPNPANDKKKDALQDEVKKNNAASVEQPQTKPANSDDVARNRLQLTEAKPGRLNSSGPAEALPVKDDVVSKSARTGTPEPLDDPQAAKTPVVTGAWIDTTVHEKEMDGAEPVQKTVEAAIHDKSSNEREPVKSEPVRPKSAVSAILQKSREKQGEQLHSDKTAQLPEEPAIPDRIVTITAEIDDEHAAPDDDPEIHLTQAEKDRRQESLAMEGLDKHLRAARTGIKDVSRGLRRVEHTIVNVDDSALPADFAMAATNSAQIFKPVNTFGYIPCETCGGCYHSVWYALWSEFRSCFYTWDRRYKYRLRLTILGFICASWLIWYILERCLCAVYCRPLYTTKRFYDIDPRAPRYPFVLPTLIFRPFLMWVLGEMGYDLMWQGLEAWWHKEVYERFITGGDPCWGTSPAICRRVGDTTVRLPRTTIRQAFDYGAATRSQWAAAATATAARVVSSFADALDEAGSMWDDQMVL